MAFFDPWLATPDGDGYVPRARPAIPWQTYRVHRAPDADGVMLVTSLEPLINVACEAVEERIGDRPSSAGFRYVFGGIDPLGPQYSEQALSTVNTLPHRVTENDELAVAAIRPDGERFWIFDGFPLIFSMRIDRATESVTFLGVGISKRCFDRPIGGAVVRENDDPETVHDVPTDTVLQFNPKGLANASPGTADSGEDPYKYPVLMDPLFGGMVPETDADGNDYPRMFDLSMAVAHILYLNNPGGVWIRNPERDYLDALLVAREPKDGVPFDPNDPATYDAKPLSVADTPHSDRPWPAVVHDMIKDFGFDIRWPLTSDSEGNPVTSCRLFLKQAGDVKPLLLQERGSTFDPAQTNLGAADLSRDLSGVVNQWTVAGALDRYEASFVLAPIFPSQAGDEAIANLKHYKTSDPDFATSAAFDAYRTWVLDEDGSGHYTNLSTTHHTGLATSLDGVFGEADEETDVPQYVTRRRPPIGQLFTRDSNGKPLQYRVSLSTTYSGPVPGLWDGTATDWRDVHGAFHILKDRVGVRITATDPNECNIGKHADATKPFSNGMLKVVNCIAAPDSDQNKAFFVRLTCVVEADRGLRVTAERQDTSPLTTVVERVIDARDRYARQVILAGSEMNDDTEDIVIRDDTDAATAEAKASRTATEAGAMEGTATIPRFTMAYGLGDRISAIEGRNLGLRTDTGGSGFAAVLPIVVSRRWSNSRGGQTTQLEISDVGMDRQRYGIKKAAGPVPYVRRPPTGDRAGLTMLTSPGAGAGMA